MYRSGTFETNNEAVSWMNILEKEGYTFVSSNAFAKFGYVALNIIMHKQE